MFSFAASALVKIILGMAFLLFAIGMIVGFHVIASAALRNLSGSADLGLIGFLDFLFTLCILATALAVVWKIGSQED